MAETKYPAPVGRIIVFLDFLEHPQQANYTRSPGESYSHQVDDSGSPDFHDDVQIVGTRNVLVASRDSSQGPVFRDDVEIEARVTVEVIPADPSAAGPDG